MAANSLNTFGAVSYSLAAIGSLVLAALMLVSWRGRRRGVSLIVATSMMGCWSAVLAVQAAKAFFPAAAIYAIEALHDTAWIIALVAIAGSALGTLLKRGALLVCLCVYLAAPLFWWLESKGLLYVDPTLLLSRSQLACSLCGLILIEQIYRNSTHAGRESIKYFVVGVGALFTYDLLLYSHAELLHGLSLEAWNVRGFAAALAVPLIALSAQRTRDWSLDVFVSRQAVFYSGTFLFVGAYLTVMAIGGYYVREFAGEWGRVGQLAFFAGSGVALAGLLASATLRRQAAVFINKHFYRNKYDYRIEWLRFIQTLSSREETDVRRTAIRAIAQIFASPGGVLFLQDEDRQKFAPVAAWPMSIDALSDITAMAADADLPSFLVRKQWIVDLRELRVSPDVYGNLTLPAWLAENSNLRIVSPLLQLDDVVGFICLYEPPAPFDLTYEDRDLLKTVGRHVATHIAQEDANRRLSESRQFEAYNRLTAFMMHDLKNSVAQLKLIVENSARHKRNPDFVDDAIATIGNTVDRMSRLIEQLRGRTALERVEPLDLSSLAREAAIRCSDRRPEPTFDAVEPTVVLGNRERLASAIEHILRNAQDATSDTGSITMSIRTDENSITLSVTDTGAGMEPEFVRDRLFRPFDSTKGSKGMGIGAYQVREYIRSLGGSVEVRSTPRIGTVFSFILPRLTQSSAATAAAAVAQN